MVVDLFTVSGFLLFVAMVAALLATHDYHHGSSDEREPSGRSGDSRRHIW